MIQTYGDGSTVEIGQGNTHPPGWKGQHGNVNRVWARANGGDWHPTDTRSDYSTKIFVGAAETAGEAMDAICPGWRGEPTP